MIGLFIKKPLLCSFAFCLLLFLTAGFFADSRIFNGYEINYFILGIFFSLCGKNFYQRISCIICSLVMFLFYLLLDKTPQVLFLAEIVLLFLCCYQYKKEAMIIPFGIIVAAFILHLFYIELTPVDVRQHDLNGIFLYMKKITEDGLNWSGFDPWYMYYLFHQPLHFIIAGYFYIWGQTIFSYPFAATEYLQYLSLFYVTGTTVFIWKICRESDISSINLNAVLILAAFNPTLILFSGFISNDTPVLFWSVLMIYYLIRWYKNGHGKDIILAALGFSVATLTKLSVLMSVPAIVLLFAFKIYSALEREKILSQISFFVIIAVPLSLVWIIRNHILYDMQFYNIPETSPFGQSFAHLNFNERIGDFSNLFSPFIHAPTVVDNNMFLSIIKTELFGEWDLSRFNKNIYYPALILYLLSLGLKICILSCLVSALIKYQKNDAITLFFGLLFLTIWGYSFYYTMVYPYVCSSNYRYFALLILPEIYFLGKYTKVSRLLLAGAIIYAFLAGFIYLSL